MDIKKITDYIAESKWTAMLRELPVGTHTIPFPNVEAIRSCKAIAYAINSDNKAKNEGNLYYFGVDKMNLAVEIRVEKI